MTVNYTLLRIGADDVVGAYDLFNGEHKTQTLFNKHYLMVHAEWEVDSIIQTLAENGIEVLQVTPVVQGI